MLNTFENFLWQNFCIMYYLYHNGYSRLFTWAESLWDFLIAICPLSVCKLFTFSSSSPEPLCWFQPNLAQSIIGKGNSFLFFFLQMKCIALFKEEIHVIANNKNKFETFKNLHQNCLANFNQIWQKAFLVEGNSSKLK